MCLHYWRHDGAAVSAQEAWVGGWIHHPKDGLFIMTPSIKRHLPPIFSLCTPAFILRNSPAVSTHLPSTKMTIPVVGRLQELQQEAISRLHAMLPKASATKKKRVNFAA
jgi:hypothetical protein